MSDDMSNDLKLIEAIKNGNSSAFEELVKLYWKRIYLHSYQMTNSHEEAEDITQETFLRAYKAISSWKPQASFYTWLYRIAHNLCIDAYRTKVKRSTESFDDEESQLRNKLASGLSSNPHKVAQDNERNLIIRKAIEQLSDRQREAFILHWYDGFSVKEVAEILKCAEGTVKVHLSRSYSKLYELLKPFMNKGDI